MRAQDRKLTLSALGGAALGVAILGAAALIALGAHAQSPAQSPDQSPTLPPAEYVPLPVDTRVYYDSWSFRVRKSNRFDVAFKTDDRRSGRAYAAFGLYGEAMYPPRKANLQGLEWKAALDDQAKAGLRGLWPLKTGNRAAFRVAETAGELFKYHRSWDVDIRVTGTAAVEVRVKSYPAFVVESHLASENRGRGPGTPANPVAYVERRWYHPASGLVLKLRRKWSKGAAPGGVDSYELVDVDYPDGAGLKLE